MRLLCLSVNWDAVSAISGGIAALITAFALWAAFLQIKKINKRNEYDIYFQIKKDVDYSFITKLIKALKDNSLQLVDVLPVPSLPGQFEKSDIKSKFLDHIEDAYVFFSREMISIDIIESGFGTLILDIGANQQVRDMIDGLRTTYDNNNIYSGFEGFYLLLYSRLQPFQQQNYPANIL